MCENYYYDWCLYRDPMRFGQKPLNKIKPVNQVIFHRVEKRRNLEGTLAHLHSNNRIDKKEHCD